MTASSKLTGKERSMLIGDTIARDIWSAQTLQSGRLLASVTDLFLRAIGQAMSPEILDAALRVLITLETPERPTRRVLH